MALLSIENLQVDFTTKAETTTAVKDMSLTVHRGEILALVGESGSGKSVTALSILQLLPQPPARYTSGHIFFEDGTQKPDLLQLKGTALQAIRGKRIGFIFQEPMTSLNPVMRCGPQVAEALRQHKSVSPAQAKKQTLDWFARVKLPLPEALFHRYPHQLSGGQNNA